MKKLNLRPPNRRVQEIYDHNTNVLTRVITEDVDPIIEQCLHERNNLDNGFTKSREMRKIGSIPMIILDQWFKDGFNPFRNDPSVGKEIKRRLNDMNKFRSVNRML